MKQQKWKRNGNVMELAMQFVDHSKNGFKPTKHINLTYQRMEKDKN